MCTTLFPSQSVVDQLRKLPTSTHQATEFFGKTPQVIAEVFLAFKGQVVINDNKVPEKEMKNIQAAIDLVDESKVVLFSQISDDVKEEEDRLLRLILEELVDDPDHFYNYLMRLVKGGQSHWEVEWRKYIVRHEVASKAHDWKKTHHRSNIGDPDSDLWDKVVAMIEGVDDEIRQKAWAAIIWSEARHEHLTTDGQTVNALLLAFLSNFVRGGIFYGITAPSKTSYYPREQACLSTGIFFRS